MERTLGRGLRLPDPGPFALPPLRCILGGMRSLLTVLAAIFTIAGSLRATDLPTLKTPLPDVTTPGSAVAPINLQNFFEVADIHGQVVQFRTTSGSFNLEMLPAAAPQSVANFLTYVNGSRYANTIVHRSDQNLGVIQGGGYFINTAVPLNVLRITADPPITLEYNLPNTRGTIAMARTGALNSATSEWFINTNDNTTTLGQANGGGYAVFGRVTGSGMTVVDAIHALPVFGFASPFNQLPLAGYAGTPTPVVVANLIVMDAAQAIPIFPATAGQTSVVSFSVANTNPSVITAAVSGSTLNIALAAGQTGSADLTVTATDTNGNAVSDTFRITVTAVGPDIAVGQPAGTDLADGGSRAFPPVSVGGSADLVFTITNLGSGNLTLTGAQKVAVDGANANEFSVTAQPVSPVAAISGSANFTVRFAPTSIGAKTAALHIASDDGDENPFNINLTGLAAVPEIAVEQPAGSDIAAAGSRAFPLVNVGNSATLVFTIKNTGLAPLTLTGTPKAALDGADVAMFSVTGQPATTVAGSGGSTTFTVRFAPTSGGVKTAALHIANDDSDENPFDITLSGTGNARPVLTLPASTVLAVPALQGGTAVNFTVAANDPEDGSLTPIVTQPSGSFFSLGDTTVIVRATDSNGAQTTASFTVRVAFPRPNSPTVNVGASSLEFAPLAGVGEPLEGAKFNAFGPPAIGDLRAMAARVIMLKGRTPLGGILVENAAGARTLPAYQGGPVPGIPGVGFVVFREPLIAPNGSIAFLATLQGGGVKPTEDFGVWTDAFGSSLELVLREGHPVPSPDLPAGALLAAVPSLSLRNGELLALITLSSKPGVVSLANDQVLLRMTSANTATVLLREGSALLGSRILTFSVLSPALGSPGQGRWQADGATVAKVVLYNGRTLIVRIAPDGTTTPILSSIADATPVNPSAKWAGFGLPAVGSAGNGFVVAAALRLGPGSVGPANDFALLFNPDGNPDLSAWSVFARKNDPAPVTPAGPLYATLRDPLVNDAGQIAFIASLQGPGLTPYNRAGIFAGLPGTQAIIARLGAHSPDEDGNATTAVWTAFTTIALPSGPDAGVIFLGETSGGDTTPANKLGLWAVDSQGTLRRLLRTSKTLTTSGSPITNLTLLGAVPGAFGATRSFNATGSIAVLATVADKTQSLLRVDIP